jgi:galactoside O-acetyltransferase
MSLEQALPHDWFPRPLPASFRMGERSWLFSAFACMHCQSQRRDAIRIGHDTGIYLGTAFELGPEGAVDIGNFCTIVGSIICTNQRVWIEDYTFIAHEVVIADRASAVPWRPEDAAGVKSNAAVSEPAIHIGANCWIGARAIVLSGAKLGEGTIVGAAAVVDFEVPPFSLVAGNPARIVRSGAGSSARTRPV